MKTFEMLGGRKFILFIVGTLLFVFKFIDMEIWKWVTISFVAGNMVEHMADVIKKDTK